MSSIKKSDIAYTKTIADLEAFEVDRNAAILIAFSGGPDSTALTSILNTISKKWDLRLGCAYYDHKLRTRKSRSHDMKHVLSTAQRFGIEFHAGEADKNQIKLTAKKSGKGIEEAARNLRYSFLEKIRIENDYDYIATGHISDDQFETLIQRFFQGSGTEGLMGIPAQSGHIIRPLLRVSREDILCYLKDNHVGFVRDTTNKHNLYLRNKIRNKAVPLLLQIFPGHRRALSSLSEKMRLVNDFIGSESERQLNWTKTTAGFTIPVSKYKETHPILRLYSLYKLYNEQFVSQISDGRLPYSFLRPAVFENSFKNGKTILNGHGFSLRVEMGQILWNREVVFTGKKSYLICVNRSEVNIDFDTIETEYITIKEMSSSHEIKGSYILKDGLSFPFLVRSSREGDIIELPGGRKAVKKLLNEWKVPEERRWEIPVVEDRRGILAVLGNLLNFSDVHSTLSSYNVDIKHNDAYYFFK